MAGLTGRGAFYADLHIHSKYSRATSKHCDLEHLFYWARRKGIAVVATGDFTHPAWRLELAEKLVPAEPGLFRLRPDLERAMLDRLPLACQGDTRFMLSVEISTIYKRGDKTRKVHHLIYAPDFERADRVIAALTKIGNLKSDGRPILGLDSRHLLEITLEAGDGCYLVPAHVWTPWFSALGSKSGFDAIDDCYGDLASHIFAIETGLSSDPAMNWLVSSLDRFRLVSNSDAHSPEKLGREACAFDGELDYFAIRHALQTGEGYRGTVEFFPEEGKYHLDGHRACGVRLEPAETRENGGRCPVCTKPLTVGVMHRVCELADRDEPVPPPTAGAVASLVPLPEILGELCGTGPKSKAVARTYDHLLGQLGSELSLLTEVPLDDVRRASSSLFAEALDRLRSRRVVRHSGYDGEYGVIRLFEPEELAQRTVGKALFAVPPGERPVVGRAPTRRRLPKPDVVAPPPAAATTAPGLDDAQRAAAEAPPGPTLVTAGPGSGKTRTLVQRIAYSVQQQGVAPAQWLAITFTRRAADEMRERLAGMLDGGAEAVTVTTFHALGLTILREQRELAGLQRGVRVAAEPERLELLREDLGLGARAARRAVAAVSLAKRTGVVADVQDTLERYTAALEARNAIDFDDLVVRAVALLERETEVRDLYHQRWPHVALDELQDIDEQQARLVQLLAPPEADLFAIGDPDQAIYGFRGADVRFFTEFAARYPAARQVRLARNYRSTAPIVRVAAQLLGRRAEDAIVAPAGAAAPPPLVELREAATERAEAEAVVHAIESLVGGPGFFSIDSGRSTGDALESVSFADFAVLYRTDAQAAALVEALERSGFPYQKRSHAALADHPGVPELVEAAATAGAEATVAERLTAVAVRLEAGGTPARALREAAELLTPLATQAGADFEQFRSLLALGAEVDCWDPRAHHVSLLTLHASKGLEFPVVFIVGCEDGLLPLRFGGEVAGDELDEERRLFYVGATRAQRRLYLSWARQRRVRGRLDDRQPSPFLADVDPGLLRSRGGATEAPRGPRPQQLPLFADEP
ncbi:MAG: UvrD-helicase domain-containing protein [Planctomycetota bacterium]